jgi:predicted amidohydrolase
MARITLIQVNLQNNKTKAIEHVLKLIDKVGSSESDILCLPELWYSRIVTHFETEFMQILHAAREYNITIIPGAFLERNCEVDTNNNSSSLCISSPVIAKNGTISGRQLKIHPFGSQRKVVKGGPRVQVFETEGFRFGIGICYDIVFPEVARALTMKGADVLFFPSKIRNEGIKPWHMYVQVRALENRIPIAAPNVCGTNSYKGKSILVDFDYYSKMDIALPKLRIGSPANEQILTIDVDLKLVRRIHKNRFDGISNNLHGLL